MAASTSTAGGGRFSAAQAARLAYAVPLPAALAAPLGQQTLRAGATLSPASDGARIAALFPATYGKPTVHLEVGGVGAVERAAGLRVGVVLSGGQAAGGHSVIAGLFDGLARAAGGAPWALLGFRNGPKGVMTGEHIVIDEALMARYRNMGARARAAAARTPVHAVHCGHRSRRSFPSSAPAQAASTSSAPAATRLKRRSSLRRAARTSSRCGWTGWWSLAATTRTPTRRCSPSTLRRTAWRAASSAARRPLTAT
jgi:hypothetical protein